MPYHIPGAILISDRYIDGVGILCIPKVKKVWYYTVVPGFSVEEFIDYHERLKCGNRQVLYPL